MGCNISMCDLCLPSVCHLHVQLVPVGRPHYVQHPYVCCENASHVHVFWIRGCSVSVSACTCVTYAGAACGPMRVSVCVSIGMHSWTSAPGSTLPGSGVRTKSPHT